MLIRVAHGLLEALELEGLELAPRHSLLWIELVVGGWREAGDAGA
jgi:hypothetical protein